MRLMNSLLMLNLMIHVLHIVFYLYLKVQVVKVKLIK